MPSSKFTYTRSPGAQSHVVKEEQIEYGFIGIPRNKDLEMVEHLGSGLPLITEFYGPECFRFTENFLRFTFPANGPVYPDEETAPVAGQATEQVTEQVIKLLTALSLKAAGTKELMESLQLKHRPSFLENYLNPALQQALVEMTQPDSPRSPTQKYRLTDKGRSVLK